MDSAKNKFLVYVHKRPDGSPFYVGKGTLHRAKKILRVSKYHRAVVDEFGRENIAFEILKSNLSEDEAFDFERQIIPQLKALGVDLCNRVDGGRSPTNPCEETRRMISEWHKGRPISAEVRENMRRGQLGRKHPEEVKLKIGAGNKGKFVSEETKEKLRLANVGKKLSEETKRKVGEASKGNHYALGNKFSPELKEYLSRKRKGVPWTESRRLAYDLRWGNKSAGDFDAR